MSERANKPLWRQYVTHLIVALFFAALTIAWTFPLILQLSTHLPGAGVGDNALFLWNFWWMRAARAAGTAFFHTTHLFAPAGADLTLHTHTALPAFIGATLFGRLSVVSALNLTTMASLALNGFCAYLLAWRIVRERGPAVVAGMIFATSPYIAAHLNGHFNLTTAWTVPLFAICVIEAMRGARTWAVAAGIVLGATAYIDYYYLVYEVAFAGGALLLTARRWSAGFSARQSATPWLKVVVGAIVADIVLLVAIIATGGFDVSIGSIRVSMHDPFNLAQLLAVLSAIALCLRFRPRVSQHAAEGWSWPRAGASMTVMVGVFLVCLMPLLINGMRLLADGQYVTQHYRWRSGPIGIDVATLLLGNPFHSLWGEAVQQAYSWLGIDLIESGAWLGIVPVALAAIAVRRGLREPVIQFWAVTGVVFLVWAIGSHIHAAGYNTGLIMPQVLLRYVPIAANARMPGRAMVMVYLALGVLAAIGLARVTWRPRLAAPAIGGMLVLAEFWSAPFPTTPLACSPMYQVLRDRPEPGAVAELPLGLGDGLSAITPTDMRVLACQYIHGRPVVGGVLARLPPSVLANYRADPLIAAWLQLSGASKDAVPVAPLPDAVTTARRLADDGIAFVILNRRAASEELREFVERAMPLTLIAQDEQRSLYRSSSQPPVR